MSFFVNNNAIFTCDNTCSINLHVDDKEHSWLVDTGASISALKLSVALELRVPIHKSSLVINGIGGKLNAIGFVYLNILECGQNFSHKFYVFKDLPCKYDGILGIKFLSTYNATLNFQKNTLTLFSNKNVKVILPLLVNKQSFFIPARSESLHFVCTNHTEDFLVCAAQLEEGIFVASTLVRPRYGKIPIQILNTTENDITLDKLSLNIHKVTNYNICTFDKCDSLDQNRVKTLLSRLQLQTLNIEERVTIQNLCAKFSDIFYLPGDKLTTTDIYTHSISLKPNVNPVYIKPYRLPHAQKNEIQKQLNQMLDEGIIEKCTSEWSSPILLVPKKSSISDEKRWRIVVDYRKLNNCICEDKYPLPNITEILDSLSGCVYFSHLDMKNGYYQCDLEPDSRKYTAFCSGQYQMTRMPMGLKTSPNAFSRLMNIAMSGLTYEKCLIYLDDLIVFGRNLENHNKNLMEVFTRLRKVNLKLNPEKCEFLKKEILYLGHVVSSEGVLPDPEKIIAIKNYPVPKNSDELKRFVAFANYYRKFICNFAKIAYPLNYLSRKNVPFVWDTNCQKSFELLKEHISSPPVLQYPNFSENNTFILQTDASGYSLGAVLSNGDNRPVAFASRSLNKSEQNYATIEKELLAIVWAIKHFRPYLYGRTFIIRTDHKPLIYLFSMKDPSSRLLKLRLLLEEYNFNVEYVKGSDNTPADAMSRIRITSSELKEMNDAINVMTRSKCKQRLLHSPETIVSQDDRPVQPKIVETHSKPSESVELKMINKCELVRYRKTQVINKENERFLYIASKKIIYFKNLDTLSHISPSEFVKDLEKFCNMINVDVIYILKNKNNNKFIEKLLKVIKDPKCTSKVSFCILKDIIRVDNNDKKKVILNDFHLLPSSGHAGMRRMYNNVKKYYFWPGMENDIRQFVRKCEKCQKCKYSIPVKEPMVITTTANYAFEKVFLDVVGPLEKDNDNYSYILTLQCELSKYVEAYPLVSKKSDEVARAFVNNFILRYGVPRQIATDKGTEFLSTTFQEVCKLLNIKQLNSTAYHHQSIGSLENTHKHLAAFLRIQSENRPGTWSSWLSFWSFSFNTSVHSETKFTPFELVYGRKCSLPGNLLGETVQPLYNHDNYPCELRYRIQSSQNDARKNLLVSKIKRKYKYDSYLNPITYKPNDYVLIKNEVGSKLDNVYMGPFKVLKDVSPNLEIDMNGKPVLVHKNRTKLYVQ